MTAPTVVRVRGLRGHVEDHRQTRAVQAESPQVRSA
jgi:hypothetical protein